MEQFHKGVGDYCIKTIFLSDIKTIVLKGVGDVNKTMFGYSSKVCMRVKFFLQAQFWRIKNWDTFANLNPNMHQIDENGITMEWNEMINC